MATQAALVLAVTAGNKTYAPLNGYGGPNVPAVWLDSTTDPNTSMGARRIEIGLSRNSAGSWRTNVRVIIPNVVDVAGVPTLVSKAVFDSQSGGFILSEKTTSAQKLELYEVVKALMAHAVVKSFVTSNEPAT